MPRLAPKVSVAMTTAAASTAPAITERTGTAVRPRPCSSANRRPATPVAGSPAAMAALTTPDPPRGHRPAAARCGAPAGTRWRPRSPPRIRASSQRPEPEHGPVQVHPAPGLDRAHRPEQGERRQADRHGRREQRPGEDGAEDAGQPVRHRHGRPGAQGPQDLGVAGAGPQLPGDRLSPDQQRREPGNEPEHAERDGLRPDRPLRLGLDDRGVVDLEDLQDLAAPWP